MVFDGALASFSSKGTFGEGPTQNSQGSFPYNKALWKWYGKWYPNFSWNLLGRDENGKSEAQNLLPNGGPSGKLRWQWHIPMFKRKYIFKWSIFYCYVSLLGCRWWCCITLAENTGANCDKARLLQGISWKLWLNYDVSLTWNFLK